VADVTSFAQFVHAHSRSLLGTAYLLTGDVPTAEDLVQDTLTKLLPKWARVTAADAPVAYVRKTLINTYLDSRRRRFTPTFALEDVEDPNPGSADFTDQITDRHAVLQLLEDLPPRRARLCCCATCMTRTTLLSRPSWAAVRRRSAA
jgi:DNA-directed RNA polymerase specialized sigma24 family protein